MNYKAQLSDHIIFIFKKVKSGKKLLFCFMSPSDVDICLLIIYTCKYEREKKYACIRML